MARFTKTRRRPEPGSIPALLQMFEHEVRFYRQIAPVVGVRVPKCFEASESTWGFRLELEDLSDWHDGADPLRVARLLAALHQRWNGEAEQRWPWLDRAGRAAAIIGHLYDGVWARLATRADLAPSVQRLGSCLVGNVAGLERDEATAPRRTLIHGDASLRNTRTSQDGEIVLLDWEDVRLASGVVDLAWLLVSSVEPEQWEDVIAAYAPDRGELVAALPAASAQGVLCLSDAEEGSETARGWLLRLEAAARLIE